MLIGEGFARGRIILIICPACVEMKVMIYKETRGEVSFLSEVNDAENSCSDYEIMLLFKNIKYQKYKGVNTRQPLSKVHLARTEQSGQ